MIAEVDRRGQVLRLQLVDTLVLPSVHRELKDLGFGGEVLAGAPPETRWYGLENVRELSREEAEIVARRVVVPFARSRHLDADSLVRRVATALSERFVAHAPDPPVPLGAVRRRAAEAVEAAVRDEMGPDLAAALAHALEVDLSGPASPSRDRSQR